MKQKYKVIVKELILNGINELIVNAGCAEEADQIAIDQMAEYVNRESIEIISRKRLDEAEIKEQ